MKVSNLEYLNIQSNIPVGPPAHQIQSQRNINRPLTETGWSLTFLLLRHHLDLWVPAAAGEASIDGPLSPLEACGQGDGQPVPNLLGTLLPQKLTFSDATLLKAALVPPNPSHPLPGHSPFPLPATFFPS